MVAQPLNPDANEFKFVPIKGPCNKQDRVANRSAKSHAVKHALKAKRLLEQESKCNFRVTLLKKERTTLINKSRFAKPPALVSSLSLSVIDPFGTLPVDNSRLQMLLDDSRARKASEPVFSITEDLAFQNFHTVFRTGLTDPALANAVMLSLLFAVTEGNLDTECLKYKVCAIAYIRDKVAYAKEAASESTIGAILLLVGVEAQLGMTSQVQLHMEAVRQLLEISRSQGHRQDLNASILSGSDRIVDHTTFSELLWQRDSFTPSFYQLPSGFQQISHLLSDAFIEVLEDLHALQCIRNWSSYKKGDPFIMAYINNHTASIQSRIGNLVKTSPMLKCCYIAAYICSIMLCCHVWCTLSIPSYLSSQLLDELQRAEQDAIWNENPDMLLWLQYIGGTFASPGPIRSMYIELLRRNLATRFSIGCDARSKILEIMRNFIWSDLAFISEASMFWEEVAY
ncbi:hypothetical protein TRIATDRAFT_288672 [Trichoderma atroviride IMI 206040]|uniref:Transcription factor domain-containing protein n=1 Tax=Hypocrea atroviridis (strain ATCC 20476 / IMI 206040) TaxID=452589 RepID=G9NES7_HYPAI|nr:uncharacterized protein TRIATDRAFT_288672 [Trichoderma atroviride IMI 206040]EHK50808.1 hypothetical protein TRIATDRAFT_288672 [Trichoderma atroviride IMI 206040]